MSAPIQIPRKFQFLFKPAQFKVLFGGRGGAKSWSIARTLVIIGRQRAIRWLCARETMASLQESVIHLLALQIKKLGLNGYHIERQRIWHDNGTEFTFAGLKGNELGIKSYEGLDGVWVEEAENVSKASWDALLPTIRKAGSEVWVSFNPKLATAETYRRFVLNPPPDTIVVKVGWQDNPWFTDRMRALKDHCKLTDGDNYMNIWEGECAAAVEGAVFGDQMREVIASGRVCSVPYDPTRPVDTVWDLGHGDMTSIWFVQAVQGGWFHFIDFEEDNGTTVQEFLLRLQTPDRRRYVYGNAWLPHDAVSMIIHKKLAGGVRDKTIEMILREGGWHPRMVPEYLVADSINAARTMFPLCRFDQDKCAQGIHGLQMYQWGPTPKSGVLKSEPLHDKYSHCADAFRYAITAVKQPRTPVPPKRREIAPPRSNGPYSPYR